MNTAIGIVLVLGVIILVHEWGHFIIARLFGVRVDVFSIGFGPRLFGFKWGVTDWRISAVPLGGYVRMAGQDITEVDSSDQIPTGAPDELMSKPRWQRALISVAGPTVNLLFPILLLSAYYLIAGVPYAAFLNKPIVVAAPPAQQSTSDTLQSGDHVLAVNSLKNPTWEQAQSLLSRLAPGTSISVQVENNGATRTVSLPLKNDPGSRPFGYYPIPARISEVASGTPADHAGLRAGDVVRAIDGQKIDYWDQFVDMVRGSGGRTLQLEVERGGQTLTLAVTPKQGIADTTDTKYQIGVAPEPALAYKRVGVIQALSESRSRTWEIVEETFGVFGKLFSGRVSAKQLQSFIGISRAAGEAVSQGPFTVISLMALISVNLGILNLLPIPILDGGHILLLSLEGIRRRDFSLAFKERFIQVGLVFLLVLFAYVMYNDVVRLLPSHS
ncbi:MAG TPA: RIP metalloprotease RseP [Candidatus Sulfotelmatobacter sp.]|jgi:regulator of sigma E protease|nr:RIP metalloprotease RseP [Candidatus Sulfotelmatobacter sp.]